MVQLELPHVNVLTKVDLLSDKVRLPAGSWLAARHMPGWHASCSPRMDLLFCQSILAAVSVCALQTVLDAFLYPDTRQMAAELSAQTGPGFRKLNDAVRKIQLAIKGWPATMLIHLLGCPGC